jgi:hypothetical protein
MKTLEERFKSINQVKKSLVKRVKNSFLSSVQELTNKKKHHYITCQAEADELMVMTITK